MILLLGSSGYIGSEFARQFNEKDVWFVTPGGYRYHDYTSRNELEKLMQHWKPLRPRLVINCAAFIPPQSVDQCEDFKAQTLRSNLMFPTLLAQVCCDYDVPLIHISTGCLFNGDNGGRGYSEDDIPHLSFHTKCGVYVGAKQLAEEYVEQYDKAYICRIRLPFDHVDHPRNYLTKLQRYPKVYDNNNSISHRGDFVKACLDLWEKKAPYGTYNMTNPGSITARQICDLIKQYIGPRQFEFWDEDEFMRTVARTPKSNCVLNVDKLRSAGVIMRPVQEAVVDSLRNWIPQPDYVPPSPTMPCL